MTRANRGVEAGLVLLAVAAIGLLTATMGAAGPAARPIEIKAKEFVFDPKEVTVKAAEVTFAVKNEGAIEHNFIIEDSSRKTVAQIAIIEAGKIEEVKVTLRAGTYGIVCNLPGHKDAGMTASLKVQP